MDKFDSLTAELKGMQESDSLRFVSKLKREQCICLACAVHNDCSKANDEALFCLLGKGRCEYTGDEPGCLCPDCPLIEDYGMVGTSFCGRGPEQDQRRSKGRSKKSRSRK